MIRAVYTIVAVLAVITPSLMAIASHSKVEVNEKGNVVRSKNEESKESVTKTAEAKEAAKETAKESKGAKDAAKETKQSGAKKEGAGEKPAPPAKKEEEATVEAVSAAGSTSMVRSEKKSDQNQDFEMDKFEDDEDLALDELEAMTISAALAKKNWSPPPKVNCVWSPYEKDGTCSKTCGGGNQKMVRHKATKAAHGGKDCSGAVDKLEPCEEDDCPTTTTTTTVSMTTAAGAIHMVMPFAGIWILVVLNIFQ